MIRYLTHELIDKSQWDHCISRAVNGNLNVNSWYLDIVCPGWCALVEDDYKCVFPLPAFSRAGHKYLMQPYFTQQLGFFFTSTDQENRLTTFLENIPPEFKYIDINLNSANKLSPGDGISELVNLELDLNREYNLIESSYQNNLKRNLKKAESNKLSISKNTKPEEIIKLFRANKGQDLLHLSDNEYNLIKQIAHVCFNRGTGEIWSASDEENNLVASVLWVSSHKKAVFLFSAVSATGKKLNAMPWLIDAFIRENAGKPLTLDFEGSNDSGLARFYKSFGSETIIYQRYTRNTLPVLNRIGLHIWRKCRNILKKSRLM